MSAAAGEAQELPSATKAVQIKRQLSWTQVYNSSTHQKETFIYYSVSVKISAPHQSAPAADTLHRLRFVLGAPAGLGTANGARICFVGHAWNFLRYFQDVSASRGPPAVC